MPLPRWLRSPPPAPVDPVAALDDPDLMVRQRARQALVDARDVAGLERAFATGSPQARKLALAGLIEVDPSPARLAAALGDADPEIRRLAARSGARPTILSTPEHLEALGRSGGLSDLDALIGALDTPSLREAAWVALGALCARDPAVRAALPARIELPVERDAFAWCHPQRAAALLDEPAHRERVAPILGQLGDPSVLPALARAVRAGSPASTRAADQLGAELQVLLDALEHPDTVEVAASALAHRADPRAIPALEASLGRFPRTNAQDPGPDGFIHSALDALRSGSRRPDR